MLKNCSQGSFIKQVLLKGWVYIVRNGQSPNLKTLTREKSEKTLMVDNLKSAAAKKKIFPVEAEETATPEKVSECK